MKFFRHVLAFSVVLGFGFFSQAETFSSCRDWKSPASTFRCSDGKSYFYGQALCSQINIRTQDLAAPRKYESQHLFCERNKGIDTSYCLQDTSAATTKCHQEFQSKQATLKQKRNAEASALIKQAEGFTPNEH